MSTLKIDTFWAIYCEICGNPETVALVQYWHYAKVSQKKLSTLWKHIKFKNCQLLCCDCLTGKLCTFKKAINELSNMSLSNTDWHSFVFFIDIYNTKKAVKLMKNSKRVIGCKCQNGIQLTLLVKDVQKANCQISKKLKSVNNQNWHFLIFLRKINNDNSQNLSSSKNWLHKSVSCQISKWQLSNCY